ncbi:pyridinium-3,5-biscarboxylic acid mononucleotide sulfurtransferase [Candidatus Hakubella thermalkaliphila]|uniref:Pyridinium-3,5-biscarboxylic acid mononucleotide sulfurtransferase n=2 Tax=Candidatus Hakubella thermalkaliphila TaxID=2754717 RepID=A0A6V8NQY9_9ACTN|nr:pyridinium-3,5-biscarboxylic acid mononucleotide sulfurtransferase [Candidatus Hakubella thermalkaliphila]
MTSYKMYPNVCEGSKGVLVSTRAERTCQDQFSSAKLPYTGHGGYCQDQEIYEQEICYKGMDKELAQKYEKLKELLTQEDLVVAYSGGVDSTLLLKVAQEVLGDRVVAVTALSPTYPEDELEFAREMVRVLGVKHILIISQELEDPGFVENSPLRCYYCKRELFGKLSQVAQELGIRRVAYGQNLDDLTDYRPGHRAAEEFQVCSPLREAGFNKEEIRKLSRELGLPTWDRPQQACLSSRFPYGLEITEERLEKVEKAESLLCSLGFTQLRVRIHDDYTARIEVPPSEFRRLIESEVRSQIVEGFRKLGFIYISLDLAGFRSGSANEVLMGSGISQGRV